MPLSSGKQRKFSSRALLSLRMLFFDRAAERQAIEALAKTSGVPFHGFWLDASETTLLRRIEEHRNDPSDATAQVLAAQIRRGSGKMTWQWIDAAAERSQIRATILALLQITS
jgi:uncharacterized protein